MNDQMKALLEKAGKRLDLVITGALVLILVISGWLFLSEQGSIPPEVPPPTPKRFAVKLPLGDELKTAGEADEKFVAAVRQLDEKFAAGSESVTDDANAAILIRRNMFDLKSVREQQEAVEEIKKKYLRADGYFKDGKYKEARSLVDEILAQDPGNAEAADLKNQLDRVEGLTAPSAEAPATTP